MYYSNKQLSELLRKVSLALEVKGSNRFRVRAYEDAADTIDRYSGSVYEAWEEGDLEGVPDIGSSIAEHLDELFNTGQSSHFQDIIAGVSPLLFELDKVSGIGPKTAMKLIDNLDVSSLEGVVQCANEGKITSIDGFAEKSQQEIKESIECYLKEKTSSKRMLLDDADHLVATFISSIPENEVISNIVPVGSVRRRVPTVGDIDFAIETDSPREALSILAKHPFVQDVEEKGDHKATMKHRDGFRIDVLMQPHSSFASLLQHFTGSKSHNIALRKYANNEGYSLSEYGIKKLGEGDEFSDEFLSGINSEEEFYNKLGLQYIPPELREGGDELGLAKKNSIPKLVQQENIIGDLHIHSNYDVKPSHDLGADTVEVLAKRGHELGYAYIGIAEHNPAISINQEEEVKAIMEDRKRFLEQINNSIDYIEVINCMEIDILSSGEVSLSDELLGNVTFAIAGIHSAHSQSQDRIMERYMVAIEHQKIHAISHPSGRLINERREMDVDWQIIFDKCVETHTILEINSSPKRLDLPDYLVLQAKEQGVKMMINTDAHSVDRLDFMHYGIDVARRGWCETDDIVNTWEWKEIVDYLRSGGKQI